MKVIICGGEKGKCLVYGEIDGDELPMPGENVRIKEGRMILKYTGTSGIFSLAKHGPGEGSRITTAVDTTLTVRQTLAVSPVAAEKIEGWPDAE